MAEDIVINDPAALQLEIDRLCRSLDNAGRELGLKLNELGDAEIAYGDAFDDALAQLVEDYDDKRLPGEDVRRALIHKTPAVRDLYHEKRKLERRTESLEKWIRLTSHSLNGRQSQLSSLKSESSGQSSGLRRAA